MKKLVLCLCIAVNLFAGCEFWLDEINKSSKFIYFSLKDGYYNDAIREFEMYSYSSRKALAECDVSFEDTLVHNFAAVESKIDEVKEALK